MELTRYDHTPETVAMRRAVVCIEGLIALIHRLDAEGRIQWDVREQGPFELANASTVADNLRECLRRHADLRQG